MVVTAAGSGENAIVIYVGTRKLVGLVGSLGDGDPRITRHGEIKNPEGFKNGLVTSLEKAAGSLEKLVDSLLSSSEDGTSAIYVVLGNSKIKSYQFSSSRYYQGFRRSISPHDVRAVMEQTRSVVTLPLSEYVLQTVPESFLVNDIPDIRNPLGMEAERLAVTLKIFTMDYQDFKNIVKTFETAEIEVRGYYPKSLVISEAVLSDQEKEEGACLVDIADDSSQLILWKNGRIVNTRTLPWGGSYLTDQIAKTWGIEPHDGERVKEKFATLEPSSDFGEELIPLVDRNGKTTHQIHRQTFQKKFTEQTQEWLGKILTELDSFAASENVLYPHYVFTGGGTCLDGFLEFLQTEFSRQARIGYARKVEAPNEILVNPSLTGVLGMYRWLATWERTHSQMLEPRGVLPKTMASLRNWFSRYF